MSAHRLLLRVLRWLDHHTGTPHGYEGPLTAAWYRIRGEWHYRLGRCFYCGCNPCSLDAARDTESEEKR